MTKDTIITVPITEKQVSIQFRKEQTKEKKRIQSIRRSVSLALPIWLTD